MPILIMLKGPRINIVVKGEIKDEDEQKWDRIFHDQMLMVNNKKGRNVVIPLAVDCNIALLEEVTDKDIKEQEKKAEERRKQMEAEGGSGGSVLSPAQFAFPSGKRGRG